MEKILFLAHTNADGALPNGAREALSAAVDLTSKISGSTLTVGLFGSEVASAADSIAASGATRFLAVSGADFGSRPHFRLFNCSGRLVREIRARNNPAAGIMMGTSGLGKGIYFLEMDLEGIKTCHKMPVL